MALTSDEQEMILTIAHYLIAEPNNHHVFRHATPPCIHKDILYQAFGRARTTFVLFGLTEGELVALHPTVEGAVYLTSNAAVGLQSKAILHAGYLHLVSDMEEPEGVYIEGDADEYSAAEVQAILDENRADLDAWAARHWTKPSFLSSSP